MFDTDVTPGDPAPVRRPFTNRHDLLAAFDEALASITPQGHSVLNFHGVGGIGKSSLLDHLADTRGNAPGVVAAYHDFGVDADARDPGYALAAIRASLARAAAEKGERLLFPTFDLAFAHYWSLRAPHLSLKEARAPFLEEGGALFDLLSATGVPLVGLLTALPKAVGKLNQQAREWWTASGERDLARIRDLRKFEDVEPYLRMFLATDLRAWLADDPERSLVLLLDTHESFSETPVSGAMKDEPDRWLRDFAGHLAGVVLVIAGRGTLGWPERQAAWADVLRPCCVDDFEPRYIEEYLQACRIAEPDVRAAIAARSRGVPLYLDVAVTTYERIRRAEGRPPRPDEFDASLSDLFERFLRYSDREERAAFEVLSVPDTFDRGRFEDLMRTFATGYPATTNGLKALCAFDFVREVEPGRFAFHALVRDAIAAHHAPEDRAFVHGHLLTRAEETLEDVTHLTITAAHRRALQEGVTHAQELLEPVALLRWYSATEQPFFDAAEWALLQPLRTEMVTHAETQLGSNHPYTLTAVNDLGYLLSQRGDFDGAERLYLRALTGREATLGPDNPATLVSVNNLGYLYKVRNHLDRAEPLYRRALAGRKAKHGPNHPAALQSLNNLAGLLVAREDFERAEPLLRQALAGFEATLGPDAFETLIAVDGLGQILFFKGEHDEAEMLHRRALSGFETARGTDHPDTLKAAYNLSHVLNALDRLDESEALYRRTLAISEAKLGPDDQLTQHARRGLANLLNKRGGTGEPLP